MSCCNWTEKYKVPSFAGLSKEEHIRRKRLWTLVSKPTSIHNRAHQFDKNVFHREIAIYHLTTDLGFVLQTKFQKS